MTGVFQHFHGIFFQDFHVTFSDRTVQLTSLTETAAADTASLDLQNHSVLRDLNIGNHRLHRIKAVRHIRYQFLADGGGNASFCRPEGSDGAILMISGLIEPGGIHSGQFRSPAQKFFSAGLLVPTLFIEIDQRTILGLSLSDIENIKEIRNGLRIVGAGTAADDDRTVIPTFCSQQRNARQIQNL